MSDARVFTLGHGNRTAEELAAVLVAHGVERVCDVRSFPRSRRWPHFDRAALEALLPDRGVEYAWLGRELGGFRKPRPDSPHTALAEGFRGYADHMEGKTFRRGLDRLREFAGERPTACLCAELDWRHCHRRHLADALVAEGVAVLHLRDAGPPTAHRLDPRVRREAEGGRGGAPRLVYDLGTQTYFGM